MFSIKCKMLHFVVLLNFIIRGQFVDCASDDDGDSDFGAALITNLRNDANLDLSVDEEYEDLRAELLAYHSALASLSSSQNRRSMMTTPCWQAGGICINVQMCTGFRFLTEIPGCKDRFNVCCFAWNKYKVRDFRDKGIGTHAMPWSLKQNFGGKGVIEVDELKSMSEPSELDDRPSRRQRIITAGSEEQRPVFEEQRSRTLDDFLDRV